MNEYLIRFKNEFIKAQSDQKSETILPLLRGSTYNTSNATSYALQYAINPNPAYYNFDGNSGGDCTNFITQCLKAGGISMHTGGQYTDTCWYYNTSTDRSSSWAGARQFQLYIHYSVSKINMTDSSWANVTFGDLIQLLDPGTGNAYHSLIITGIAYNGGGKSDLLVCAHSTNRSHVALSVYYGVADKAYYHIIGNK